MVDDNVVVVGGSQSVAFVSFRVVLQRYVAQTEAHKTDDDVVGSNDEGIVGYADAVARGCLSGNGQVAVLYLQLTLQMDSAAEVEDNGAWPFLADSLTQRTRQWCLVVAIVLERSHMIYIATATSGGVHAETFSSRECGNW